MAAAESWRSFADALSPQALIQDWIAVEQLFPVASVEFASLFRGWLFLREADSSFCCSEWSDCEISFVRRHIDSTFLLVKMPTTADETLCAALVAADVSMYAAIYGRPLWRLYKGAPRLRLGAAQDALTQLRRNAPGSGTSHMQFCIPLRTGDEYIASAALSAPALDVVTESVIPEVREQTSTLFRANRPNKEALQHLLSTSDGTGCCAECGSCVQCQAWASSLAAWTVKVCTFSECYNS